MTAGAAPAAPSSRAALVHDWLTGMRGGEKVLEQLCVLLPGAPVYTLFHFPGAVSPAIEAHPIRPSFLQQAPLLRSRYRSYLPLFPAAIEDLDLGAFDLVVSSSHCVAKGVIPRPGAFHLCYCHTPMRYAWDQEHAYFPRRRGVAARLRGLALSSLRTWDAASASRVDLFVANSRFVAGRIRRYYGRDAEVVHPPVDVEYFTPANGGTPARSEGGEEYCLAVAALAPYKRLETAVAACARLGIELRIVGEGPERARLERGARDAGARVRFLGRVGAERLRDAYRGALCLLQPGVEDFGIAAVEALACACPVVAAGRGGVLDIVEDEIHGVLHSEDGDTGAVAAAIDKTRQIRFNPLNLRRRAEQFSGARFRERIQSLLSDPISR